MNYISVLEENKHLKEIQIISIYEQIIEEGIIQSSQSKQFKLESDKFFDKLFL